jgi:hypothetical protein
MRGLPIRFIGSGLFMTDFGARRKSLYVRYPPFATAGGKNVAFREGALSRHRFVSAGLPDCRADRQSI